MNSNLLIPVGMGGLFVAEIISLITGYNYFITFKYGFALAMLCFICFAVSVRVGLIVVGIIATSLTAWGIVGHEGKNIGALSEWIISEKDIPTIRYSPAAKEVLQVNCRNETQPQAEYSFLRERTGTIMCTIKNIGSTPISNADYAIYYSNDGITTSKDPSNFINSYDPGESWDKYDLLDTKKTAKPAVIYIGHYFRAEEFRELRKLNGARLSCGTQPKMDSPKYSQWFRCFQPRHLAWEKYLNELQQARKQDSSQTIQLSDIK